MGEISIVFFPPISFLPAVAPLWINNRSADGPHIQLRLLERVSA